MEKIEAAGVDLIEDAVDPFVGMHYVLHGYVAESELVTSSPLVGMANTFTAVFNNRPENCRYAVAQGIRIRLNPDKRASAPLVVTDDAPSGPFICWDLLDDLLTRGKRQGPNGMISAPPPIFMGPTADGVLMKALAQYGAL